MDIQALAQFVGDGVTVLVGVPVVVQLILNRKQVRLLADQVNLQRQEIAHQAATIEAEAERNRKRDELLDGQLAELRRRQRTLDRQQATQVDVSWHEGSPPPNIQVGPGGSAHTVWVFNNSPRPIREVRAGLRTGTEQYRPADVIRPIKSAIPAPMFEKRDFRVDVLPAGEGYAFVFGYPADQQAQIAARFVDDEGREWQVEENRSVRELAADEWSA